MGNIPSISDVGLSSLFVSTLHFLKNLNEHDNASKAQPSMKRLGNASEENPGRNSMGEETSLFKCFCVRPSEPNVWGESTLENEIKLLRNVLCLAWFFYQSHMCITYISHLTLNYYAYKTRQNNFLPSTSDGVKSLPLVGGNQVCVGPEGSEKWAWLEEIKE